MLMKKDFLNLRRSRWLLLSLFALFVGVSPAWASITYHDDGTVTEGFDEAKSEYSGGYILTLPTGWNFSGTWNYNWSISSESGQYKTAKPSIGNYMTANTSHYLITPELEGDFSFWMRSYSTSNGSSVAAYECTYENDVLTVGNKIGEITIAQAKPVAAMAEETISYNGSGRVALLINYAYIDDFTYTPYEDKGAIDKPTAFTASNVTYNSAQLSWTAGGTETAWQLLYSSDVNFDKDNATPIDITDNPYTISNLTPETSYNAYIRAKSGEDVSSWVSVSFTTLEQYAKPTGLSVAKQGTSATLTWTVGGTESAWDVVYSTNSSDNPENLSATTVNATTHTLTDLTVGTTYYVWVRANHGSEGSGWINASFTLAYSTPAPTSVDGNGISNVTYGTGAEIVNYDTSKTPYYQDNTAQVGAVTAGSETTIAITFNTGYTYGTVVWVDWNQNYEFEDSEIVFAGEATNSKPSVLNAVFTVPAEQAAGNYRMRICAADSYYDSHKTMETAAGADPDAKSSYCVAQDYTLKVKEAAAYAMSVSDTDIAFGTVKNTTTTKTFTIINDGDNALTNVSVVSSDNDIFTVSETGFDIPAEGSKVITVTFIKGVAGNYSETITVSQANVDNKAINVTATYEAPSPATMAITIAEATVGETVAFGSVGKQAMKTFTVTNDGDQTLNVTIASNNTTDFSVSPEGLEVAGGSSETFTVTFVYDAESLGIEKTANITVTPSNEGLNPVTFAVTATSIEQWSEDFSGNALPEGWETTSSTYWTFADGIAKSTNNNNTNYYLTTPSLKVEEGASLSFDVLATVSYVTLTIEKQKDNGTWETCKTIQQGNSYDIKALNTWENFSIDGLETGNYKFRFNARGFWIDNFQGFKRNMNDPKLGIYSDAECTTAVTTSVTKDFGFATEAQTATYYIKNDGTGTMTLSLGENPDGITASLDKTSVAAGEHATLTIAMPAENKGYNGGNIVVTAKDGSEEEIGTFTVTASGVMIEEGKMNLNFADGDIIPTTWTQTDWTKNDGGYYRGGYSSTTMETSTLTATAGEEIVIVAKQEYTSGSFSVNYRKDDTEEWSTLIASTSLGNSGWVTLHAPIAEAGDYKFQIVGNYYTQIQRIYGLEEIAVPAMVLDKEDDYSFGLQTAAADYVITVTNEGNADLTDLTAVLANGEESDYTVSVSDATVAPNETATITVTQKFDLEDLGSHSDVLTISSNAGSKTINLSGSTRDGSKLYVDFDNPNSFPEGWQVGANWQVYTYGTDRYAYQSGSTATTIVTTPLTVAEGETLTFKVARYTSGPSLQIRYSQDGGVTWSDYTTYYTSDEGSSAYTTKTIEGIPAGTTILEFLGKNIKLDAIEGFGIASAPAIALTESGAAVAHDSTKAFGTLTAEDGTATYTLSNVGTANMVSTVEATGDITMNVTAMDEGVTQSENTLTIPAGKTATIVVTIPYAEPYTAKSGTLTINTEGWIGDMTVNFTASVVDPTAIAIDFADNKRPEGWYVSNNGNGFSFSDGFAKNSSSEQILMSEKMVVSGEEDVLTYEAMASAQYYVNYATLTVSYSTDRVNWTPVAEQPTLGTSLATFQVKGLAAGNYYLQFKGAYVTIDNIIGWHKVTPAPEHDLYMASYTLPVETVVPGTEYTATINVASLRADETVTAQLWMQKGEEEATKVAELTEQTINNGATKAFTLTGIAPATEGSYKAWATVFNANETTVTTDKVDVIVSETRTLEITDFALTSDNTAEADANNQFTSTFNVTVKNTGTVDLNADQVSVSIVDAEGNAYGEATTWTAANSQTIFVTPGDYTTADAVLALYSWGKAESWSRLTETNIAGFYSGELNGNTNFRIVRLKPSTAEDYNAENNGLNDANIWNRSTDMATSDGNVFTFKGWDDKNDDGYHWFTYGTMAQLAVGISTTMSVSVTTSALEGGTFTFKAKENLSNTVSSASATVTVNAAAPKFELALNGTAIEDGDAVAYGIVKEATTKTFTISNTGTKLMEAPSISVPEGFEANYVAADGAEADWRLYFYKENTDLSSDQGIFKTTATDGKFIIENVNVPYEGVVFSVHNDAWTSKYGWSDEGRELDATGKAVKLAAHGDNANGWMTIPTGNYDFIWNANDLTLLAKPAGSILAGETADVNVTLKAEQGKVSGNLVFTYKVDASTNKTFTLALSGRSIAADTWTEDFADGSIPATWTNGGWSIAGEYSSYPGAAYYSNTYNTATLMTPRLAANENDELTFDVLETNGLTVEYSTNKTDWTQYGETITTSGEKTFVAPATANYYLRFTTGNGKRAYVDNFVGFKLNIPEHDTEIAASSVPATGKQYNTYTATVTLKENAGKAEEVTAELYVNNEVATTKTETITANGTTVITLTWEPEEVIEEAVKAYVEITATGIELTTAETDLTVAEVYTLDEETSASTVETVSNETVLLKREFVEGWNTVCLPFTISDVESFFGIGAKVYDFTDYTDGVLKFTAVNELTASYPYIVYVPAAITQDIKLRDITISSANETAFYRNWSTATFRGTYAPMAVGTMEGLYGVTNEAKIAKGTAEASMKGFRAYFELSDGVNAARLMMFDEDGVVTTINAAEIDRQNAQDTYNLQGQKLTKTPKKGLYIVGGKKTVVR